MDQIKQGYFYEGNIYSNMKQACLSLGIGSYYFRKLVREGKITKVNISKTKWDAKDKETA